MENTAGTCGPDGKLDLCGSLPEHQDPPHILLQGNSPPKRAVSLQRAKLISD
jgi:hypothetical protein